MKKIILLSLTLVCCAVTVVAQPAASKTQKPESVRRRAVNLPGSTPNGSSRRQLSLRFGFHFRATD
jgi:hypothetical protein